MREVLLGYVVGSGLPVKIPVRHLAVTGQTQQSGKTTTLEGLVARSGLTALTFVTKRGEGSFESGRRVTPYFRDRADWQFVTSIIDATLQEKNKFLRPWIMKICRDTETLADVQNAVREALRTARGINEGVYTQLDAYLDLIVPEIGRARLAEKLDLSPGLNVMDVSAFATPMQMLFIQSALDWVNEHCRDTIVVVPEAWEFVPEGKGSPVKASAVTLVRKGAGIGNFIWIDSQDMAGVDKTILRGCTVWLMGVQREANEIKRNLTNIPAGMSKPPAAEIALLERGQFFACFGKHVAKVYVRPSWMSEEDAIAIARGETTTPAKPPAPQRKQENEVTEQEAHELRTEIATLKAQVAEHGSALQAAREEGVVLGEARGRARAFASAISAGVAALQAIPVPSDGRDSPRERQPLSNSHSSAAPSPAPKAERSRATSDGVVSAGALSLLDVLVTVHPNRVPAELWGAFARKAPSGGHWNGQVKTLRDAGYVDADGSGYAATSEGLKASCVHPAKLADEAAMFAHYKEEVRSQVEPAALSILSILALYYPHRLTAEQWGLLADKKPSGGHWNGAVKSLRDWALVVSDDGRFSITPRGLAILETKPQQSKATKHDLHRARRAAMSAAGQRLFDGLKPGMSRRELADALGMKPTGGHWNGALKELLESGLVRDNGGKLVEAVEDLA